MREKLYNSIKLIKQFGWNSIFYKNLLIFTLVIVLPVLLMVSALGGSYQKSLERNTIEIAKQNNLLLSNLTEKIVDETGQMYYLWVTEDSLMKFFGQGKWSNDIKFISNVKEITSIMHSYVMLSNYVESVYIYSRSAQYVLSTSQSNNIAEYYTEEPWFKETTKDFMYFTENNKNSEQSFSICYNVVSEKQLAGVIVFNISPVAYNEILADKAFSHQYFSLMNSDKTEIFLVGEKTEEYLPKFNIEKDRGLLQNGNQITITTNMQDFWLNYEAEIPSTGLDVFVIILICLIAAIVLSVIMALIMSLQSYNMLSELLSAVNGLEDGDVYSADTENELKFICNKVIAVSEKNKNLSYEILNNVTALKNLQLSMLQMQFTPHFLFNILQATNWYIARECGINNPANELTQLSSDLLDASLDTSKQLTSIRRELQYGEKYLKIMSLVNKNNFDAEWEVDDTLLMCKTLKLSLQVLLENAIKHGIKTLSQEEKGYIQISVFEEDNNIIFKVSNNTVHRNKEELKKLQEELDEGMISSGKQVGLRNINKRIKLIFGEDYGCTIYIENDMVCVKTKIPKNV